MIEWIIRRSVANRFLVMMAALFLSIWGTWTIIHTPVDALPDLSDVQVIVKTRYPGQAPQIVENQVTWPLTTTMLSVPGARTVRGFSQFGDSYVYVIFEDGTDPYWARSRVLEYLNQVQGKLPAGVSAEMGPDATGVGWVFEYALVDRSGKHDLAELRSLQDWFLKYELKTIPNVSEVASVGGVVKEYQIVVDPMKLTQYGISLGEVKSALDASNQEAGGSSVELAEAEYMVRASGYLQTLDDFKKNIVLKTGDNGVPVYLGASRGCRSARRCAAESPSLTARRSGRRRGDLALRQERPRGDLGGQREAGVAAKQPAGRGGSGHHLRPQPAYRPRHRQPQLQAAGRVYRRRPSLRPVPVARALGAGGDYLATARPVLRLYHDAFPGAQRQHHVAGRDRHCGGGDGRCRHRDD
ncbi:Cobalt-zinc-cadmium resistance protein CzcA; Cation efflux system protein CusA [Klebsiella pneumoniae IS43]|uniref:Cobalt-zinc-cadmium resistance protein CzcA Cation efflux system protein CusA n=1 Tax=Klebsiella pneumoniae IS43 TaxID=1432552 RepID=W1DTQ1_KLEPN|nr:Cobalt-zinc-cadmium resistance protein CzcA; Cation efflux system protein CusA [Klebsiella pneumoniae IS43]